MKFAKELEQELVPEWRAKYLDYKTGKKKVKAITKAIQKGNRGPQTPSFRYPTPSFHESPILERSNAKKHIDGTEEEDVSNHNAIRRGSSPLPIPHSRSTPRPERQPLRNQGSRLPDTVGSYGSIIATPPNLATMGSDRASFELPDPLMDPNEEYVPPGQDPGYQKEVRTPSPVARRATFSAPAQSMEDRTMIPRTPTVPTLHSASTHGTTLTPTNSRNRTSQLLRRVWSNADGEGAGKRAAVDLALEAQKRQDEFFEFLDAELHKIDSFYRIKEEEASVRLKVLRQQLHIMRDQRIQEVYEVKRAAKILKDEHPDRTNMLGKLNSSRIKDTLTGKTRFGKNTRALEAMGTPKIPERDSEFIANRRDFMRRQDPQNNEVSYRSAKRKLKHALQEFYRGIELLKEYALLNRKAFSKINKKYDKAVDSRPLLRYMTERVNKASFVQSEEIEHLLVAVEDLYSRYFERGNRKIAVSKLRHTVNKLGGDYSPSTFRAGLLLMAGVLFAIQALVYASQRLHAANVAERTQTSYLLQIYAGYFLITFHVLLFCGDCMIWTKSKINYAFVFEYDTRHTLEWRQLLEIPAFFMFMLGLFMWLNFSWMNAMYIYWPVVLIGLSVFIIFLPARVLHHRSRKWWAFSNWRLLLAGVYPVEFRDFFLGDMYCSQSYAMGNIALFFCLYAQAWGNPPQCNSSHSRLLGFFTCLPAIWRSFQCIRRYVDTKSAFPHLLNLGKYIFSILYYATLSMYRIERQTRFQASFITFALLNAVYTSVWDLIMDWSLGNAYAPHPMLREMLAFRRVWVYYVAMVLDVIIRFNWIFYAIFARDMQHSAFLSFAVSLSEVFRRGVWTIFRVENEHCTNVTLFRASRDTPLPYEIPATPAFDGAQNDDVPLQEQPTTPFMSAGDAELGPSSISGHRVRNRRPSASVARVGNKVAGAHTQDFERKRLPTYFSSTALAHGHGVSHSTEDTSDEEEEEEEGDLMTDEDESGSTIDGTHDGAHDDAQVADGRRSPMHRIAE